MISAYPTLLYPYLKKKKNLPSRYESLFFQSWEDGFWYLSDTGVLRRGVILIPSFYCIDVVENMKSHGFVPVFYPLDDVFQPDTGVLNRLIHEHAPACVVIYHAGGIQSNLLKSRTWRRHLPKGTVIVHDHAHTLIPPDQVALPTAQDIAINSLRKNVPLPGSYIYMHRRTLPLPRPAIHNPLYVAHARAAYILLRLFLVIGHRLHSTRLVRAGLYKVLPHHENLIGDSPRGNCGPRFSQIVSAYIDYSKISSIKKKQAEVYRRGIRKIMKRRSGMSTPAYAASDTLHAFALVVRDPLADSIETALDALGLWPKFPDCPWSQDRKVFYLPLGPHITRRDQSLIMLAIRKSV